MHTGASHTFRGQRLLGWLAPNYGAQFYFLGAKVWFRLFRCLELRLRLSAADGKRDWARLQVQYSGSRTLWFHDGLNTSIRSPAKFQVLIRDRRCIYDLFWLATASSLAWFSFGAYLSQLLYGTVSKGLVKHPGPWFCSWFPMGSVRTARWGTFGSHRDQSRKIIAVT